MPTGLGELKPTESTSTCQLICQETVCSSRCAGLNLKILIALDAQPVANTSTQIPVILGRPFGCVWHCARQMITCSHEMRIKKTHLVSVKYHTEFCLRLKESQNLNPLA